MDENTKEANRIKYYVKVYCGDCGKITEYVFSEKDEEIKSVCFKCYMARIKKEEKIVL